MLAVHVLPGVVAALMTVRLLRHHARIEGRRCQPPATAQSKYTEHVDDFSGENTPGGRYRAPEVVGQGGRDGPGGVALKDLGRHVGQSGSVVQVADGQLHDGVGTVVTVHGDLDARIWAGRSAHRLYGSVSHPVMM